MSDEPPPHGRPERQFNFNTGLALGAIALAVTIYLLIPSQVERPLLLFGQAAGSLDPAFFPTVVAVSMLVVGLLYVWVSLSLRERNGFRLLTGEAWWNVGVTLVIFLVYASILRPLGFLLSSAIIVAVLSVFYGARHWPSIALVAIGTPLAVYVVFRYALSVALPELPDF